MNKPDLQLPGRCYWVEENFFLAGGYPYNPGIDDPQGFLRRLLSIGIDAFVDLTEEDELPHYEKIISQITSKPVLYKRFAIQDYSVPDKEMMIEIVMYLQKLSGNGQRVYVHCRGGIGRTGTVVGCWLRNRGLSGNEALEKLGQLFSASNAARFTRSPETEEQRNFVLSYTDPLE